VIENLVANAIRFTEEGQIRIRGWEVENNVYLTVEDTGMGIAPEELPHIFDRYYHGEKSSSGLGLYIVYQIVTAHGGTIDVKSKPGEGTIFTICLSNEKELS
jgi:signal transduction histidine kinase